MNTLSKQQISYFQKKILTWYAHNKRDLPWRHTRDPYKILVSEVMSQQTQIGRVVPKYEAWIQRFPTVYDVAQASAREVLQYWSGLGYNRRALYLKKCAEELVKEKAVSGKREVAWPRAEKELRKLPGIGEYTARALLCFAFNQQIAVVDTNIRKVIVKEVLKGSKEPDGPKGTQHIAEQLLPQGHAYEWNQALMDYSAVMLKHEKIPIPKQSKFKTSDRYYRGQIIKHLLQKKQTTQEKLIVYFRDQHSPIDNERFSRILQGLLKDGLIKQQGSKVSLL